MLAGQYHLQLEESRRKQAEVASMRAWAESTATARRNKAAKITCELLVEAQTEQFGLTVRTAARPGTLTGFEFSGLRVVAV